MMFSSMEHTEKPAGEEVEEVAEAVFVDRVGRGFQAAPRQVGLAAAPAQAVQPQPWTRARDPGLMPSSMNRDDSSTELYSCCED